MGILINGGINDILINGNSVATAAEVAAGTYTRTETNTLVASTTYTKTEADTLLSAKIPSSSFITSIAEPSGGVDNDLWFQY